MKPFAFVIPALLAAGIWGCSMHQTPDETGLTPLQRLEAGNERFASFHPIHPDQTLKRLHELEEGQRPFAVIVSCSDSRVPPELVFDQGLGDLFVIRTAGNVIGDFELGSIEYAVEHLGVSLVVVMGHEECGAIKAFLESDVHEAEGHIKSIVDAIREEPEEQEVLCTEGRKLTPCIQANIRHGLEQVKSAQPILSEKLRNGNLTVVGALYNIDNGKVEIIR
jgi:carbonic anhydrase